MAPATQATPTLAVVSTSAANHGGTNGKQKSKKCNKSKALFTTKGMQWPWSTSLGMTEYESKEQRCAGCSSEA